MSAWTDGATSVTLGPKGLSVHRSDGVDLVLSLEQLGGALAPKKGKGGGFVRLRPLTVNPGAKQAFTVTEARRLVRASLGSTTARQLERREARRSASELREQSWG